MVIAPPREDVYEVPEEDVEIVWDGLDSAEEDGDDDDDDAA